MSREPAIRNEARTAASALVRTETKLGPEHEEAVEEGFGSGFEEGARYAGAACGFVIGYAGTTICLVAFGPNLDSGGEVIGAAAALIFVGGFFGVVLSVLMYVTDISIKLASLALRVKRSDWLRPPEGT